jgi:hypothetical protein
MSVGSTAFETRMPTATAMNPMAMLARMCAMIVPVRRVRICSTLLTAIVQNDGSASRRGFRSTVSAPGRATSDSSCREPVSDKPSATCDTPKVIERT